LTIENAGSVALDLTSSSGNATIESLQEQGRIVTTASVFDASQARAGGAQKAQAANLEGLGFIDTALFNQSFDLFVVDGIGIRLPEDEDEEELLPQAEGMESAME
jgi:hypothetical protein